MYLLREIVTPSGECEWAVTLQLHNRIPDTHSNLTKAAFRFMHNANKELYPHGEDTIFVFAVKERGKRRANGERNKDHLHMAIGNLPGRLDEDAIRERMARAAAKTKMLKEQPDDKRFIVPGADNNLTIEGWISYIQKGIYTILWDNQV